MKKRNKKNRSILLQLFIPFMVVVILGMIAWAILAISMSHTNVRNESKNTANEAFILVSDMYEYNPVLKNLVAGKNVDDKEYDTVCQRLRFICQAFDMQYLYLFRPDPTKKQRVFYVTTASEDEDNEIISFFSKGHIESPIKDFQPQELIALAGGISEDPDIFSNEYGDEYTWYFPLTDKKGKVEVLVGMDFSADLMYSKIYRITLFLLIPIVVQLLLILIVLMLFVKRIVSGPLSIVSLNMRDFVKNHTQEAPSLTDQLNPKGEILEITESYDKMKSDIVSYMSDIRKLTAEKTEQLALDKLTEQIHNGIMPPELSLTGDGVKAYAFTESAKNVGGDFYDCFTREDGSVCAVIGDVSGKGVAAALFMSMSKTMIREHLRMGKSPAQVLNYVNDTLCESNPEGMFATVFALVMNPKNGEVTYSNAGHTHPVLWGKADKARFIEPDSGLAIGLFPDAGMVDESLTLKDSQGLFLYTDGITEAVDINNDFFGEERLLSAMDEAMQGETADITPSKITGSIVSVVKKHEEGCLPFDDLTALALIFTK